MPGNSFIASATASVARAVGSMIIPVWRYLARAIMPSMCAIAIVSSVIACSFHCRRFFIDLVRLAETFYSEPRNLLSALLAEATVHDRHPLALPHRRQSVFRPPRHAAFHVRKSEHVVDADHPKGLDFAFVRNF